MMRSRLRRPMSKSMTATFLPRRARPHEILAEVVVLPTPPLPEVTTMISVNAESPQERLAANPAKMQIVAVQPGLDGLAGEIGGNGLEDPEDARDRHELGVELLAEHARSHVFARASHSAPAQRAVNVHTTISHHLGTGADSCRDDEVTIARVDTLAGAHRLMVDECGRTGGLRRRWRRLDNGDDLILRTEVREN